MGKIPHEMAAGRRERSGQEKKRGQPGRREEKSEEKPEAAKIRVTRPREEKGKVTGRNTQGRKKMARKKRVKQEVAE